MTENDYDDLIYAILCGEGNIVDFFDKIFDFLSRRTDFFKIKIDDSSKMGLGLGEAENIVKSVFCKYMERAILEQNNVLYPEVEPVLSDCFTEEVVITSESDSACVCEPTNEESSLSVIFKTETPPGSQSVCERTKEEEINSSIEYFSQSDMVCESRTDEEKTINRKTSRSELTSELPCDLKENLDIVSFRLESEYESTSEENIRTCTKSSYRAETMCELKCDQKECRDDEFSIQAESVFKATCKDREDCDVISSTPKSMYEPTNEEEKKTHFESSSRQLKVFEPSLDVNDSINIETSLKSDTLLELTCNEKENSTSMASSLKSVSEPTVGKSTEKEEKSNREIPLKPNSICRLNHNQIKGSNNSSPSRPDSINKLPNKEMKCLNACKQTASNTVQRCKDDQSDPITPMMDAECYNGAKYDDYSWSQSLKDVDIRLKIPSYVKEKKQVKVNIEQTHLKVEFQKPEGKWTIGKDQDLTWPIIVAESTWLIVFPERYVFISMDKMQERWWDSVFVGDPKINLRTIDPSIPYEDLDEESMAKINELMYDQLCKHLGKPSSKQSKMTEIFKEAWNAEGSPFRGQPFDPSLIDVQQPIDSIPSDPNVLKGY